MAVGVPLTAAAPHLAERGRTFHEGRESTSGMTECGNPSGFGERASL